MRTRFQFGSLFPAGTLLFSGRQFVGLAVLNVGKAAIFVGVGHWLHDTPPIFQTG
jgi:hypothetical protein